MLKHLHSTTWLKVSLSIAAIGAIIMRLIWPDMKIDIVTLGLVIVAALPWLSAILESAKFPGGWEVKFRDVQKAAAQVTGTAESQTVTHPEPAYLAIAAQDPNLALVGLRIEIEKRLRDLAAKHGMSDQQPIRRIFDDLRRRQVIDPEALSGLDELIMAGNRAAHGARVEASVAQWAIDYGPRVLAVLDDLLKAPDGIKAPEKPSRGRGQEMAEALASLADRGTFSTITDPVSWQRDLRHEHPLPTREP